ncbi:MAG: purine-nucleoside phosphorylase [Eubacteriaceae bacterium]|nr:purine-nucleoside phosphorylase [Eubacteriaceae bacterium]
MNIYEKCVQSAEYIKTLADANGAIGLILGSGLGPVGDLLTDKTVIPYGDIPNFPVPKVEGHAGELIIGNLEGVKVICMKGRFHFYEGYSMQTVSMPVRVMKLLGIRALIVTNAAGGVNRDFSSGNLMLIDDIINFMGDNPLVGENVAEFGTRFPDMTNALSPELKDLARKCAKDLGIDLREGVYMAFRGPNYETPAEVRFAKFAGADAVGMSTVPEIMVARHASIPTIGISCITNMAAGITGAELSHEEVAETANRVFNEFKSLVIELVKNI